MQVQQITSARSSSSFSLCLRSIRYLQTPRAHTSAELKIHGCGHYPPSLEGKKIIGVTDPDPKDVYNFRIRFRYSIFQS